MENGEWRMENGEWRKENGESTNVVIVEYFKKSVLVAKRHRIKISEM